MSDRSPRPQDAVKRRAGPKPNPYLCGLLGRCPNCGQGPLFNGVLSNHPACPGCGFDHSVMDAGDGPSVFAVLIVGAIITIGALFVELAYQPPYWVHALLWLPLVIVLPVLCLRVFRGLLYALQIHHDAREIDLGAGGPDGSKP